MKRNVGKVERLFRALGGLMLVTCAVLAPLPLAIRVATFGVLGAYLLFSALAGSCLGYALMGRSTCPLEPGR
ncbi:MULTISPECIES: DUF2892 domain-containing protein [Myxococcus]|uniref:DUF2892 domain-containing protein n=1 Tax=Myxococcus llanfairpwllgwyngyllgogerychwyrndrobwllllantysiliogogogochensis TaxID=2590453 RepID=A0A540WVG8_9BACT|nr:MULTISPECIES: DUF2892 domain-containing protein [Myxococcus]NTX01061.1 DUF2892 domain-containing protein [Myxococcus sp. CA040A]TQF13008.1 DUF2892 domain-containing protein [Myxococcus llanfairpwllgwyngyllgogerychwyrndrobwllllantysiliogogogochensis]